MTDKADRKESGGSHFNLEGNGRVTVKDDFGNVRCESNSVEANFLFHILAELSVIRMVLESPFLGTHLDESDSDVLN